VGERQLDSATVGRRVRAILAARTEAPTSLRGLARAMGVPYGTLAPVLRGAKRLRTGGVTLAALADALEVERAALIDQGPASG